MIEATWIVHLPEARTLAQIEQPTENGYSEAEVETDASGENAAADQGEGGPDLGISFFLNRQSDFFSKINS